MALVIVCGALGANALGSIPPAKGYCVEPQNRAALAATTNGTRFDRCDALAVVWSFASNPPSLSKSANMIRNELSDIFTTNNRFQYNLIIGSIFASQGVILKNTGIRQNIARTKIYIWERLSNNLLIIIYGISSNAKLFDVYFYVFGNSLPTILQGNAENESDFVVSLVNLDRKNLYLDPRALASASNAVGFVHRFGGLACVGYGFARQLDLLVKQHRADQGYQPLRPGNDGRPENPISRLPLGGKIALAALALALGIYNLGNAFATGSRRGLLALTLNAFGSFGCIVLALYMGALIMTS